MRDKPTAHEVHQQAAYEVAQQRRLDRAVSLAVEDARALEARRLSSLLQEAPFCDLTGFCEGGLL